MGDVAGGGGGSGGGHTAQHAYLRNMRSALLKVVLDREMPLHSRIEKMVPMSRLTTIVMPHRGPIANLRPKTHNKKTVSVETFESQFKTMTTIQLLGYGLATPLPRQLG